MVVGTPAAHDGAQSRWIIEWRPGRNHCTHCRTARGGSSGGAWEQGLLSGRVEWGCNACLKADLEVCGPWRFVSTRALGVTDGRVLRCRLRSCRPLLPELLCTRTSARLQQ